MKFQLKYGTFDLNKMAVSYLFKSFENMAQGKLCMYQHSMSSLWGCQFMWLLISC